MLKIFHTLESRKTCIMYRSYKFYIIYHKCTHVYTCKYLLIALYMNWCFTVTKRKVPFLVVSGQLIDFLSTGFI